MCQPVSHLTNRHVFCVTIINTHSGQSASAPLTSVLWYSRIFFFCGYCLKQTQTSRAPQYPWQTPELKEYWSAKYLHGWSSCFSHGNIWSKNSTDGESDADLKCKLCFCFAGKLRCHDGNTSRKTKEVGKKKKRLRTCKIFTSCSEICISTC